MWIKQNKDTVLRSQSIPPISHLTASYVILHSANMRTPLISLLGLAALGLSQAQPHSAGCSTATNSAARPAATPGASEQLFQNLYSAPSAVKRYQRLFVDGDGLRTGDALRELTVFDFNGAQPASGAEGGATKSIVSTVSDSCMPQDC
jgi:hypothetical protein